MIQIKSNKDRDLDSICQEHYDAVNANILTSIIKLKSRQKEFIQNHIREIITGKPNELNRLNGEFISHCKSPGKGSLLPKNVNKGISACFNYDSFSNKNTTPYNAYDLAKKLLVNVCPYCNRNYTVTVTEGSKKHVRPDFDHFMPKGQFPLLSMSFYNLIPSCLICNRTVKNQAKFVYGKFIHPYEEDFGNCLKINHKTLDVSSQFGLKQNIEIIFLEDNSNPNKLNRCKKSAEQLKIKEIIQESHKGEIADILRKHYISSGAYLHSLHKAFPTLSSIDELYRIAFGAYYSPDEFEKRPLSKLTKDTVDQLLFTYPITK